MIISRVADEKKAPQWMNTDNLIPSHEKHIETLSPSCSTNHEYNVDEECDKIEACASSNNTYACNANWPDSTINHLREWAIACGMPRNHFKIVTAQEQQDEIFELYNTLTEQVEAEQTMSAEEATQRNAELRNNHEPQRWVRKDQVTESETQSITKTAQTQTEEVNPLQQAIGDPFHIEERSDTSHMEPDNWASIKPEQKLNDQPAILNNSIRAIRGGENYNKNRVAGIAQGQNSIASPDAIENLSKSDSRTAGEQLQLDNAERKKQRDAEYGKWEDEKIATMSENKIIPKGNVFPTQVMNAQTGLDHTPSKLKPKSSVPEYTEGEKLAEANEQRRKSIQRESKSDNSWQKPRRANVRSISDTFAEELKKNLGK